MEEIHRRIPHRPPFLFIDEIIDISKEGAEASLRPPDFLSSKDIIRATPLCRESFCESVFKPEPFSCRFLRETLSMKPQPPFCPAWDAVSKEWFCLATRSTYPSHLETGWEIFQHDRPNQKRRQGMPDDFFRSCLDQDEKNREMSFLGLSGKRFWSLVSPTRRASLGPSPNRSKGGYRSFIPSATRRERPNLRKSSKTEPF